MKVADMLFGPLFFILYILQYLLFPGNANVLDENFYNIVFCVVPCFYIGRILYIEIFEKPLFIISAISIILDVFYYLIYSQGATYQGSGELATENMSQAYQILLHVCYCTWYVFKHFSIGTLAMAFVGFVFLLFMGCRGAIISYLVFLGLYLIFSGCLRKSKTTFFILITLVLLFLVYFDQLFQLLFNFSSSIGFSTRIFDRMVEDAMVELDIGREYMYTTVLSYIINDSLGLGYGLCYDRIICDPYAHNFILEILLEFGMYIGSVLLLGMFVYLIYTYLKRADTDQRAILLMFFACSFVHLFFSSSYLLNQEFFVLFGYCSLLNSKRTIIYS